MKRLVITSVALVGLLLAGCGSDSPSADPSVSPSATASSTATPTASGTGKASPTTSASPTKGAARDASPTPKASSTRPTGSTAGMNAAALAARLGCTDVEITAVTSTETTRGTTSAATCELAGKKVEIAAFRSPVATRANLGLGKAMYRKAATGKPAYVAVGETWIVSDALDGSRAIATAAAQLLRGRVESLAG